MYTHTHARVPTVQNSSISFNIVSKYFVNSAVFRNSNEYLYAVFTRGK